MYGIWRYTKVQLKGAMMVGVSTTLLIEEACMSFSNLPTTSGRLEWSTPAWAKTTWARTHRQAEPERNGVGLFMGFRFIMVGSLGKTKSTVKVGSWSAVKPPPGGPITVLFSDKNHKKVAFEEPLKRYSWRDALSLVSLNLFHPQSPMGRLTF